MTQITENLKSKTGFGYPDSYAISGSVTHLCQASEVPPALLQQGEYMRRR